MSVKVPSFRGIIEGAMKDKLNQSNEDESNVEADTPKDESEEE